MFSALRFYWTAAKGFRLRPWKSPYLRWRMETFFGGHYDQLDARTFWRLLWQERRRMAAFLRWAEKRRRAQRQSASKQA